VRPAAEGDRETALKLSAYMIRRVEGSEDHAGDQHDAAVKLIERKKVRTEEEKQDQEQRQQQEQKQRGTETARAQAKRNG
jgi:hypothetical protein